jgi:hypothetical protein
MKIARIAASQLTSDAVRACRRPPKRDANISALGGRVRIQQLKRRGRDHEHVDRGGGCHMVLHEAAPSRRGSVTADWRGSSDGSGSGFRRSSWGVRDSLIATANRSESPCDAISPPSPVWRVPRRRGPAATLGRGTPIGAGRRNEAGGGEGFAAARRSVDVARRQARVPAKLGCETGTRARKREQIEG